MTRSAPTAPECGTRLNALLVIGSILYLGNPRPRPFADGRISDGQGGPGDALNIVHRSHFLDEPDLSLLDT